MRKSSACLLVLLLVVVAVCLLVDRWRGHASVVDSASVVQGEGAVSFSPPDEKETPHAMHAGGFDAGSAAGPEPFLSTPSRMENERGHVNLESVGLMLDAHESLRMPEVNDPDSKQNKEILQAMINKALVHQNPL